MFYPTLVTMATTMATTKEIGPPSPRRFALRIAFGYHYRLHLLKIWLYSQRIG